MNPVTADEALERLEHLENLLHLLGHIRPAIESSGTLEPDTLARPHARLTAAKLCDESELIWRAVAEDGVKVRSGFYELASRTWSLDHSKQR
jgi:hypothetical protein